jgi:hypothetical protein
MTPTTRSNSSQSSSQPPSPPSSPKAHSLPQAPSLQTHYPPSPPSSPKSNLDLEDNGSQSTHDSIQNPNKTPSLYFSPTQSSEAEVTPHSPPDHAFFSSKDMYGWRTKDTETAQKLSSSQKASLPFEEFLLDLDRSTIQNIYTLNKKSKTIIHTLIEEPGLTEKEKINILERILLCLNKKGLFSISKQDPIDVKFKPVTDDKGNTWLHTASQYGQKDCLHLLVTRFFRQPERFLRICLQENSDRQTFIEVLYQHDCVKNKNNSIKTKSHYDSINCLFFISLINNKQKEAKNISLKEDLRLKIYNHLIEFLSKQKENTPESEECKNKITTIAKSEGIEEHIISL